MKSIAAGFGAEVWKAKAVHTATIILLHGLGDSSAYWRPFIDGLQRTGPMAHSLKVVALDAPMRNIWGSHGPSWFEYLTDRSGQEREDDINEGHLSDMRMALHGLMQEEAAQLTAKGGMARIIIAGSSQGGSMAADAALTLPSAESVAGIAMLRSLVLSATAAFLSQSDQDRQTASMLAVSGDQDNTFVMPLVQRQLAALGPCVNVSHEIIAGLEHDTPYHQQEIERFLAFVVQRLGLEPRAGGEVRKKRKRSETDLAAMVTSALTARPRIAERTWKDMTETERELARNLGVDGANAWDNGTAPVWQKAWNSLDTHERHAAEQLGFDGASWDAMEG